MPGFEIVTRDNLTYTHGAKRQFEFRGVLATLIGFSEEDGHIVLEYTGGIRVLIPESNIRHIVVVDLDD
jgi:hypothetical protein